AGESAGSASVSALCTSPLAKGLFRRVILESSTVASASPPHSFRALEDALASGEELMLACGAKSVEELRALPAEKIVPFMETEHHITVDGCVLTELPYESYRKGIHNEEAILHGYNSRESGPFLLFSNASAKDFVSRVRNALKTEADAVLEAYPHATDAEAKESWAEIYGAIFFDYPHYCLNRLANANGIPVYYYLFDKQNKRIGSWHGGEMIYVYGNLDKDADLFDESDFALSRSLSGSWRSFAETGDPGKTSGVAWTQAADPLSQTGFGETVSPVRESGRKQVLYDALDRLQNFTTEPINGKEGVSGAGN
ncbi:MAG: carboxylesterase family protein, partial [Clostridia bacterium]|nr:carboxylesterase family protein [Clostridia bacterium]